VDKKPEPTRRRFMKDSVLASTGLFATQVPMAERATAGLLLESANAEAANQSLDTTQHSAFVENELVRIELNPKTGDINGLLNQRTGKQYIQAKERARAFRLNVPFSKRVTGYNADYSANSLDSWKQTKPIIAKQKDAGNESITVRYPSLESEAGQFQIELSYSIRLPHDSDEAILQLEMTNHSSYRIKEIFFPWISGVGVIESEETDTFVAPNMIRSLTDIREYRQEGNWEEYPYVFDIPRWPDGYSLTMPWMNHGGKEEGLYLASLCRDGTYHMLMIQDFGDEDRPILAFAWAVPCYVAPGKSWRSPEMVLSLHSGDWHAAADKYRATLDGWYKKPDPPLEFKKEFASFNSFFANRDFGEITDLAEDIRKYGLRHMVMWNFGNYYPNVMEEDDLSVDPPRLGLFTPQWGGLPKLRASNDQANSLGVSTGIIFSQRLWNKDTLRPETRELAEKWVLRRESGDPQAESWDHQHLGACQWSNQQPFFGHLDYIMCNAVKGWQDFAIHNIAGVLSKAGYGMMFYDQAVENNLCFSSAHAHPDVSAPCMAAHAFLESLKGTMRSNNPHAVLIGEGCEVVASQILDAGWVWRTPPNPEIFRYTLPWTILACAIDVDPGLANKYFVLGLHLAIVAKGIENGKRLSDFPKFAQHIAHLASFRQRAGHYMVDGTFKDDLGLRVTGTFGKVYETQDELAVMLANLTNKTVNAGFQLDSHRYNIQTLSFSTISSTQPSGEGKAEKVGAMLKVARSLGPLEVVAVIFRREAQPA
jgi:hypothetical protein